MEKKKGRPFESGIPKDVRLTVRLDKREHKKLIALAKSNNMGLSEYIRHLILKEK